MARRKTVVDQAKKAGPYLLLDSGNALFQPALVGRSEDDVGKLAPDARVDLILSAMASLGTAAMPAGAKDLVRGPKYLKDHAQKAGLTVLSANLLQNGKPYFPASKVVTVAGVRVGLVGLSPQEAQREGFQVAAPVKAGLEAVKALRGKTDLVVVLAAIPYGDALALGEQKDSGIDFILQSHEARGASSAQWAGAAWVLPSGERGRMMARAELDLTGKRPYQDRAEAQRKRAQLEGLEAKVKEIDGRLAKATDPEAKKSLQETQASFRERARMLATQLGGPAGGARTFSQAFVTLGPEIPSDPALQKKVEAIEPPGSNAH